MRTTSIHIKTKWPPFALLLCSVGDRFVWLLFCSREVTQKQEWCLLRLHHLRMSVLIFAQCIPLNTLFLHFLYPQAFYSNTDVKQVDVTTTSGTFGILPFHVPAIAVLKPGLMTVYEEDNKQNKFFGKCVRESLYLLITALYSLFKQLVVGLWQSMQTAQFK